MIIDLTQESSLKFPGHSIDDHSSMANRNFPMSFFRVPSCLHRVNQRAGRHSRQERNKDRRTFSCEEARSFFIKPLRQNLKKSFSRSLFSSELSERI